MRLSRGFTLIELLVVIAIIGLLSSVVLASLNTARAKARDTKRVADLNQVRVALELCYDDTKTYVVNGESSISSPCYRESLTDGDFINSWQATCSTYLGNLPQDPGGSGRQYLIHTSADGQGYVLLAKLEASAPMSQSEIATLVDNAGITNWDACSDYNYGIGNAI